MQQTTMLKRFGLVSLSALMVFVTACSSPGGTSTPPGPVQEAKKGGK
jgi:hypothetical protein